MAEAEPLKPDPGHAGEGTGDMLSEDRVCHFVDLNTDPALNQPGFPTVHLLRAVRQFICVFMRCIGDPL